MKKLIILGTGGNCIDILDTVNDINENNGHAIYECIGFLDDNQENWGKAHYGIEVLGPLNSVRWRQFHGQSGCLRLMGKGTFSGGSKYRCLFSVVPVGKRGYQR